MSAPATRLRSPRPRSSRLLVVLALIAATFAALLTPSAAETPPADIPVTVTATGLTSVVDGQVAHVHVDAPTSSIFGVEARICLSSATIDNSADFSPTQGLSCTPQANPLSVGSDGFVQVATAPPNSAADLDFRLGKGTSSFDPGDGSTVTLTCDETHPCKLVLKLIVPSSVTLPAGQAYKSYPIAYAGSATAPGAPTGVTATAGDTQASVSWTAPASDGGSAITGYTAVSTPGSKTCTWTTGPLTCAVTGLTNGTAYTFKVKATNAIGDSPLSAASSPVTPSAGPGTLFHALVPARVLDSRPGAGNVGGFTTPWGAGATRDVVIGGQGGVPADADAVVLNVTVTDVTAGSFLQLWPTGSTQPTLGSSLNYAAGQTVPNAVTVKLGTAGKVSIFNKLGSTNVIADVAGYYKAGAGGDGFTSVTPARVLDSRPGAGNVGGFTTTWNAGTVRDLAVGGHAGVPADADAVVMNVTVTDVTAASFLQLWPTGATQPQFGSNLNYVAGQTVPNAVTVKLGTAGKVSIFNQLGSTNVIADVVGYFKAGTGNAFHSLVPGRVLDSRSGAINVGPYTTPWGAGTTRPLTVGGLVGIPANADSVVLNVTVTDVTAASFLQVWPVGTTQPQFGSSLNYSTGQTVPNAVTAKLGTAGAISIFNQLGSTNVIADAFGWYG
ncbi:MAG: fibronectin type III domain-containing protein [Acidimicrobiales bacterium]